MAKRRGPDGPFFTELASGSWFRLRPGGEALVKSGHKAAAHRGHKGCYWKGSTKIGGKTKVYPMTAAEVADHVAAQPPPGKGELHPSEVKQHGTAPAAPAFNPYRQRPPARPAGDAGQVPRGTVADALRPGGRRAGPKAAGEAQG